MNRYGKTVHCYYANQKVGQLFPPFGRCILSLKTFLQTQQTAENVTILKKVYTKKQNKKKTKMYMNSDHGDKR